MKKNRYFDRAEKKAAWLLDKAGRLLKQVELDWRNRSPVSGAWQVPAQMTIVEPNIEKKDGYIRIYKDGKWGYVDKDDDSKQPEIKPDPKPDEPTIAERIKKLESSVSGESSSSSSKDFEITYSDDKKCACIRFANGFTIEGGVSIGQHAGNDSRSNGQYIYYREYHSINLLKKMSSLIFATSTKGNRSANTASITFYVNSETGKKRITTSTEEIGWVAIGMS